VRWVSCGKNNLCRCFLSYQFYYKLPYFKEVEWERIYSNISIITFFEGAPIGLKKYSNYAIETSTNNNAYVSEDCLYLVSDNDEEDSVNRLKFMCSTSDGFEISRYDMQKRGVGDIIGTKQSGVSDLKVANIIDDYHILEVARKDCKTIFSNLNNSFSIMSPLSNKNYNTKKKKWKYHFYELSSWSFIFNSFWLIYWWICTI